MVQTADDAANIASISTKVGVLENQIGEIDDRILGLDTKFDRVMSGFASEFRTSIAALSTQFSEGNKTPWIVLISGAAVMLTVVSMVGYQALSPITATLDKLEHHMTYDVMPRKEVELGYTAMDHRLSLVEDELKTSRRRELEHLNQRVESLQRALDAARSIPPK
jgi:hypothetical protein